METRYFTGFIRDMAQKGRRGRLANAARAVLPYVRKPADTATTLRDRFDADLAQDRIDPEYHARLHDFLDVLTDGWKTCGQTVDVRDARDWRACGSGYQKRTHREVSFEDTPHGIRSGLPVQTRMTKGAL